MRKERRETRRRAREELPEVLSALHLPDAPQLCGDVWGAYALPGEAAVKEVEKKHPDSLDVVTPTGL